MKTDNYTSRTFIRHPGTIPPRFYELILVEFDTKFGNFSANCVRKRMITTNTVIDIPGEKNKCEKTHVTDARNMCFRVERFERIFAPSL